MNDIELQLTESKTCLADLSIEIEELTACLDKKCKALGVAILEGKDVCNTKAQITNLDIKLVDLREQRKRELQKAEHTEQVKVERLAIIVEIFREIYSRRRKSKCNGGKDASTN
jgi:hypothetical protein